MKTKMTLALFAAIVTKRNKTLSLNPRSSRTTELIKPGMKRGGIINYILKGLKMSMDIHKTIQGDFIRFAHPTAGYEPDQQTAAKHLTIGKEYQVDKVVAHNWHTKVFLRGFNVAFNSVMFDNIPMFGSDKQG